VVTSGRKTSYRGFTLIELMIGVVLVSILLAIAVPTFRDFIIDQRARAASTDLTIALMTARSEAVKRNRTVELTANGDDWGTGWTIASPNGGEPDILNHVQPGDISITGPDSPAQVDFSPSGRVIAAADFEIDAAPESGHLCSFVRLGLDGRTNFSKEACTDD
jgi:type IV fimbrial biogenesis protein FimT